MIENKLEGCLHPGKLVRALLRKVQALEVQVLTGMEIEGYEEKDGQVIITTGQGINMLTKRLLLCTNAFTPQLVPSIDIIPNRGQVLVTDPIPELAFHGTFHFDKGFYYFRNVGNRLLLGGARQKALEQENTMSMETTELIQQELEDFIARHLLPATKFTITDRWTGIMGMGTQKLPIIAALGQNVFCCVRLSGMGVALAPVMAQKAVYLMDK